MMKFFDLVNLQIFEWNLCFFYSVLYLFVLSG